MRVLTALLLFASGTAHAQVGAGERFFPADIGDRWLYAVDGTTALGDTLDATVEWTLTAVRSSSQTDTLYIRAQRAEADGGQATAECRLARKRSGRSSVYYGGAGTTRACRAGFAFPFAGGHPSSYPFLSLGAATGPVGVTIGSTSVEAVTAEGTFLNSHSTSGQPVYFSWISEVSSLWAEGIGVVSHRVVESEYMNSANGTHRHQDTLRVQLVGADVGGVLYGDLPPVASEDEPRASALTVHVGPSPSAGAVTLFVSGARAREVRYRVFDVRGRVVRTGTRPPGEAIRLDLGDAASGPYVAHVETGGDVAHGQFVIAR